MRQSPQRFSSNFTLEELNEIGVAKLRDMRKSDAFANGKVRTSRVNTGPNKFSTANIGMMRRGNTSF